ncbi:uncharacterized protein LOC130293793 [Hyla sarda]|uniref:uncharacterized protein LOC130293793 n=1 Tax=Hyla sarda TaxID=327740 RepID=UPI0024C20F37|nr:uncharacterized protein LOC130293793 [Hyla sarda]XP_056398872.1 uncharacterized protein LOC130293793 [Hyla sarda]XP_056398873.1 uncharacterized protein LOC130293793 [Hyla sarda]XP_056398874.1 uncharacterized protein LOC130293793 [Hyla sarda]
MTAYLLPSPQDMTPDGDLQPAVKGSARQSPLNTPSESHTAPLGSNDAGILVSYPPAAVNPQSNPCSNTIAAPNSKAPHHQPSLIQPTVPGPPAIDALSWADAMDTTNPHSDNDVPGSSDDSEPPDYWGASPPAKKTLFKTPKKVSTGSQLHTDHSSSDDTLTGHRFSRRRSRTSDHSGTRYPHSADPSLPTPEMASNTLKKHPELQALLALLPTKSDLQILATDLRQAWRHDLKPVKNDVQLLKEKVETLETFRTTVTDQLKCLQESTRNLSLHQAAEIAHLDDIDNRNRRNNIRIKGLPESVAPQDISSTLQKIFNDILQKPPDSPLEMDRAQNPDPTKPRDVICRIHHFLLKDEIMRRARNLKTLSYNGHPIQLYPDLSLRTLKLRAALRPLLLLLQNAKIVYKWGFPFSLIARHGSTTAELRTPADLQMFLTTFKLPSVPLPDWDRLHQVATAPPLPQGLISSGLTSRRGEPAPMTRNTPSRHKTP